MAEKNIKQNIANNIAALRQNAGLTQAQFAEKLNYTDKAISKWERGESTPDITVLAEVAELFSVSIDWLTQEHSAAHAIRDVDIRRAKSHNKLQIALLSSVGIWFCATLSFVILEALACERAWLAFVWGLVGMWVDLIVFSAVWAEKKLKFIFISLLIWTLIAAVYITLAKWDFWYLFLFGIPLQAATVFWGRIISIGKKVMGKE